MKKHLLFLAALLSITAIAHAQNNCLDFDGTDNYVSIGDVLDMGTGNFTIEAWAKADVFVQDGVGQKAINKGLTSSGTPSNAGYGLRFIKESGLNKVKFMVSDRTFYIAEATGLQTGYWYHIAGVRDGNNIKLYVNGSLENTTNTGSALNTDTDIYLAIGVLSRQPNSSSIDEFFNGQIDEVRIWNDARTEAEIRANMYKELAGTETGLVAYYKLNETNLTTPGYALDFSNNSNNGTYEVSMTNDDCVTSSAFAGPKNCLDFDGTNDYVDIGTGPTSVQSVEFWVCPTTTTEYFIDLNGSAYISSSSGTIAATGFTSPTIYVDGIESTTIVAGSWQHIAVTTGTSINSTNLDIGRIGSNYLQGKIDEVRLWSDVRSEKEIRENMCKTLVGDESGLVAYYNFDNSSGTTLQDFSGNENDGTLTLMDPATDWVSSTAFNTWLNVANTTWATATNWSDGGVPTSTDNVGIPNYSGGSHPTIGSALACNHLVVGNGVTLAFNYNESHTIHGSAFVIGHSDITDGDFLTVTKNLYILPLSTLDVDPSGQLTIGHKLDNWGTCTVKSTFSGTGSLIVEGSVSGNDVTMQRYIAATTWGNWDEGWHFLSSPVANYAIQDNFTVATAADYDFFAWSEPHNQWINFKDGVDPTFAQANGSTDFELGHGYLAAYKDAGIKEFEGTINVEDVGITNLTITGTGNHRSWHLLGNPFTSALTWYTDWTTNGNVSGTSKIWNEGNKSYSTLNAGDPIPVTNGFMVQAVNGTGTLTIPKNKRIHSTTPFYKNAGYPIIKMKANNIDNPSAQESELRFNPESTMGWDIEFDSDFLPGYAPLFYSLIDGEPMAVNSMPDVSETTSVPFTFIKNEGLNFSIEMYEVENMDMDVWLLDRKSDHDHNLTTSPVYYFTSEEGDLPERFVVHFSPLSIDYNQLPGQINIFSSKGNVEIRGNEPIDASVNVYNISGQLITTGQLNNESSTSVNVPNHKGAAIVSVVTSGQTVTEKVIIW